MKARINQIILIIGLLVFASCQENQKPIFFDCDEIATLEGLHFEKVEVDSLTLYSLDLNYPVGYMRGDESRIPYFNLDILLKDKGSEILVYDSIKGDFVSFLLIDDIKRNTEFEFAYRGRTIEVNLDSSFIYKSRKIFELRLKNLYSDDINIPMLGIDLVFFISKCGIEGMYISNFFSANWEGEVVNAPVGNIFYKTKSKKYKINN